MAKVNGDNVTVDQVPASDPAKNGRAIFARHVFATFEDFVASAPLKGLGATMPLIKRLCSDDPEALDLIDRAVKREDGRPASTSPPEERSETDNIVIGFDQRPLGNSKQKAIRVLREKRPDVHSRVLAPPMERRTHDPGTPAFY